MPRCRGLAAVLLLLAGCGRASHDGCGSGAWRAGALEIHHLDVGQADSTLIVAPSGRTLLIDAGESRWDGDSGARTIGAALDRVLGCRHLDQVLFTHFHVDHVGYPGKGGLWHLVERQGVTVGRLFHRDTEAFRGDGGAIDRWREYLAAAGSGLHPALVREGRGQIDLGAGVDFRIVSVDGHGALLEGDFRGGPSPPNENDYSVAALLRFGRLDYFIGGDLSGAWSTSPFGYAYHDIESLVARGLPDVDVYRVSHHGSEHSSNDTLLRQIDPEISIISTGEGNPHGHPHQHTVDRLGATSVLYLTEAGAGAHLGGARIAGEIVLRTTDGLRFEINGDGYLASDPARIDADGDGYFREADPDDHAAAVGPRPQGGCDPLYQPCSVLP